MKNVLKSKTIWGLIATAAAHFGVAGVAIENPESADTVNQILAIAGLVLALIGRWKATGGLSLMPTETPAPPA